MGSFTIAPVVEHGWLRSIGEVRHRETPLRHPANRFLPWFDTFEGDIFRRFRLERIQRDGGAIVLHTTAVSDPDVLFREQRDSSGDLVFKNMSWDSAPVEAALAIHLEPVPTVTLEGHRFEGFKYWFDYRSDSIGIHRFVDRQTWEAGGKTEGNTLCIRNWSHPPVVRLKADEVFSTGGLVEQFAVAFPGNLWGRWSLLLPYDFQYGPAGCLVTWFDRVSNIRSLIESARGEDWLRVLDMHIFNKGNHVQTNPKTVMFCPDALDDVAAANVWTRIYEQEKQRACNQIGIKDEVDLKVNFDHNVWVGYHFDTSYEEALAVAHEFHAEYLYIDPVWENEQTLQEELIRLAGSKEKLPKEYHNFHFANMCQTLNWEVSHLRGGEEALKRLCERARTLGIDILTWLGTSVSSRVSPDIHVRLGNKHNPGIFAVKESGTMASGDSGYHVAYPINLNTPYYSYMREKVMGMCARTGVKGFLWDSYSNLGWWHVDYASPGLEVQWEKMAEFYKDLANAGMYLRPEALVTFSNHSTLSMCGDYYQPGVEAAYGYQCCVCMLDNEERDILCGRKPIDRLFEWFAHKHVPSLHFHMTPRSEWDAENVRQLKQLLKAYREVVRYMKRRTILPGFAAVQWENEEGVTIVYAIKELELEGRWISVYDGTTASGSLQRNTVYRKA